MFPLKQGTGAFWGLCRCMCGAVAHGQNVIVVRDVAATGKVIWTLGETCGHSIGSLQDAHGWLCNILGKKIEKQKTEMYVSNAK